MELEKEKQPEMVNSLPSQAYKFTKWTGELFWLQGKHCIFPLMTKPDGLEDDVTVFNVKGQILSSTEEKQSWCKSLKIVFWHQLCVARILAKYATFAGKLDLKDCVAHSQLIIESNCSEARKMFVSPFINNFVGIVMDHSIHAYVMVITYDASLKAFKVAVPLDPKMFSELILSDLCSYFVVNWNFLHGKILTQETLIEADKRAYEKLKSKSIDDMISELKTYTKSGDMVKRNMVRSFVSIPDELYEELTTEKK